MQNDVNKTLITAAMSVRSVKTGFKYVWSKEYDLFTIRTGGDELTLCLEDMRKLFREIPEAAVVLGVELVKQVGVAAEIEGGGSTWWHVCGECHTAIDSVDRFCRQCGRRIEWGAKTSGGKQD